MTKHAVLAPFLLAAALAAQTQDAPAPAKPTVAGDTGLALVLPKGFEVRDGKVFGLRFFAVGQDHDGFEANVNLTPGPAAMPVPLDAEAMQRELVAAYQKILSGYECVEHGTRDLLGQSTFWISGRFKQGGRGLRNLQVLVPCKPAMWLTFTTTAEAYAKESTDFLAAVATLAVAGKAAAATPVQIVRDGRRLVLVDEHFALVPPPGWKEGDPALGLGTLLWLGGDADGGFAPNLNLRTDAPTDAFDLQEQDKVLRATLPKIGEGVQIQEIAACKVAGRDGIRVRASHVLPVGEICMVQYLIPGKPHSFVATFSVAKAALARWQPAIDECVATFAVDVVLPQKDAAGTPAPKPGKQ